MSIATVTHNWISRKPEDFWTDLALTDSATNRRAKVDEKRFIIYEEPENKEYSKILQVNQLIAWQTSNNTDDIDFAWERFQLLWVISLTSFDINCIKLYFDTIFFELVILKYLICRSFFNLAINGSSVFFY